ncbi:MULTISPECIES: hypothetical protein [unclassified Streptomyces]|uniref:hypothetical protein n=1 Tax=unclassified Streptomyces TaxID=2593676 RepID=UPI0036E51903
MEPTIYELSLLARQIRQGDVFTLHGRERTAADYAWPAGGQSVSVAFIGGGFAVIPEDRPMVVRRAATRAA